MAKMGSFAIVSPSGSPYGANMTAPKQNAVTAVETTQRDQGNHRKWRGACVAAAMLMVSALAPAGPVYASEGSVYSGDISDYSLEQQVDPAPPLALAQANVADGAGPTPEEVPPPVYGPNDPAVASVDPQPERYRSFGSQVGAVKWEMAAIFAYYTAINGGKLFEDPTSPHFHTEGWFGKSTRNVGVDKLAHAYSAYVVSDLLYARLKHKTGGAPGIALTAAVLASSTLLYTEFWDSIERSAGWSWEDVAFNSMGAGFSLLRNSVPGLDRKLDFRLMIVPNSKIIITEGKRHFEQQRYFFALKLAGFKAFEKGPLRFLELHAGYYGKDFTNEERAAGVEPKRRIFFGAGINLRELFFKNSTSGIGRAAGEVLDYWQPPYTALHRHVTN
jgi:hypothetical protein